MYFTDTPEMRKFEREMKQKPNFNRRTDGFSKNVEVQHSDNEISKSNSKNNDGG